MTEDEAPPKGVVSEADTDDVGVDWSKPDLPFELVETDPQARWNLLDIQVMNGNWFAINYDHILWMWMNPPQLVLHFSSHVIKLRGRNMQKLYDKLKTRSVSKIRVLDEHFDDGRHKEPFVYEAVILQKPEGIPVDELLGGPDEDAEP